MCNLGGKAGGYNIYSSYPTIPYNVVKELITDERAEILWRLLKNHSPDAWQADDLTLNEKSALVYNGFRAADGSVDSTKYSVFLDPGLADAVTEQKSFLRVSVGDIYPENRTIGIIAVNVEILCHADVNHLSNYRSRTDVLTQTVIETLNGADVGGVGVMFLDTSRYRMCGVRGIGSAPYKGKIITFGVNCGDLRD